MNSPPFACQRLRLYGIAEIASNSDGPRSPFREMNQETVRFFCKETQCATPLIPTTCPLSTMTRSMRKSRAWRTYHFIWTWQDGLAGQFWSWLAAPAGSCCRLREPALPFTAWATPLPFSNGWGKTLKREAKDVRELVSFFQGDIRTFRSNRKYPLVTIPFRPLQHMFTVEDQIAALETAAFHLDDDGLFAFDVFYPRYDLIFAGIGEEILEMEWTDPADSTKLLRRFFRKESVDKINQSFTATFIFRTWQNGKLILEETEPLKMSYYTYPHLRALFLLTGLEIVEEYGSFARTTLDNSAEQMIFVLKKSSIG